MGLSGLLSILVPFILLGGVQEPGLVEGFFSKYWGLSPPSGEMELSWEEGTKNSTPEKCFPPPQPGILGRIEGRYLEFSFQVRCLRECRKQSMHPDTCPKIKVHCDANEINQCLKSRQCPEKMKCCNFNCARKCLNLKQDICSLPKVVGPCLAFFPRWWYDEETQACSKFIYGGCLGNNNNFQSESICKTICKKKKVSPTGPISHAHLGYPGR
ncbi:PREDICTED: eppin-like [Myotis brandtii]|uniref:eppin-like n=1 Tax=Myotis brandtii TaxID=109478 RepID=UPI000703F73F|nr:PREDICTED: eppin-like [Myotis brandtii]